MKKFRLTRTWTVTAFSFLLIGIYLYLMRGFMEQEPPFVVTYDEQVIRAVKELRTPGLTRFFLEYTALGSGSVLVIFTFGILSFLGAAARWKSFLQLFSVSLSSWLLMEFLKGTVARERPSLADRLDLATGFSFPSGHSMSSSAIYFTLAFLMLPAISGDHRRAVFLGYVAFFVALVGLSRVYLGVHYPSDVFGGFSLGLSMACLAELGFNKRWSRSKKATAAEGGKKTTT